jgi:hypothetical protein
MLIAFVTPAAMLAAEASPEAPPAGSVAKAPPPEKIAPPTQTGSTRKSKKLNRFTLLNLPKKPIKPLYFFAVNRKKFGIR